MLDKTDREILHLLKANARTQLREIGERVHMTGQAVSNRIQKMESMGIIKGYTVVTDETGLGKTLWAFVTVFMKTNDHASFQKFIKENEIITEAYRISGDGCYLLKICAASQEEITSFLDNLLQYGNYRINISIGRFK